MAVPWSQHTPDSHNRLEHISPVATGQTQEDGTARAQTQSWTLGGQQRCSGRELTPPRVCVLFRYCCCCLWYGNSSVFGDREVAEYLCRRCCCCCRGRRAWKRWLARLPVSQMRFKQRERTNKSRLGCVLCRVPACISRCAATGVPVLKGFTLQHQQTNLREHKRILDEIFGAFCCA